LGKKNGKKYIDMNNFAFCTLVYGEKYTKLSKTLINQITNMGYKIFVYTNNVEAFEPNDNIILLEYTKSYFSFHEKLTVVRECLKQFETAIFLDSDVVLKDIDNLDFFENIDPGLHIFATFGNIGSTFFSDDHPRCENLNQRNTKYGNAGLELVNTLGYKCKKEYHPGIEEEAYIEHYLEGRWIVKKDNGKEEKFFQIWESMVDFCETFDINLGYLNTIGAGEGSVMSIACYNSGISYKGISPLVTIMNRYFISNYQEKLDGTKPWNIAG
jgi:hypothetical protein